MIRIPTMAAVSVLAVAFTVPFVGQSSNPAQPRVQTLTEDQLPAPVILGEWILSVGALIDSDNPAVDQYLRQYGLDPTPETIEKIRDFHRRYSSRFRPANLAARYRQAEKPESAVGRTWVLDRARFLGRELGSLLRFWESEGVPIDVLVSRVVDSPTSSTSRTYIDEEPDPDLLRLEGKTMRNALFTALGRGIEGVEEPK